MWGKTNLSKEWDFKNTWKSIFKKVFDIMSSEWYIYKVAKNDKEMNCSLKTEQTTKYVK